MVGNEAEWSLLKNKRKSGFSYELRCDSDLNEENPSCCSFYKGIIKCKPAYKRSTTDTTQSPVKEMSKIGAGIQRLFAIFEKNLFNRLSLELQREERDQAQLLM